MMMKMKIWKWALALVLASGLAVSCAEEEKEQEKVQLLDCSFKINISDITGNSVKLSAVPTKMSVKYWLSVVRKDIYKLYSSDTEFAADYLTDMKMNAAEKGIAFNEYVEANRISGYSPKLINGLSPQTDYVAYAYGLSDDWEITTPLSTTEFRTGEGSKLIDMDFTFEISDVTGTEAVVKVTPERNDVMYYYDILPVSTMTKYTEAQIIESLNSEGTLVDHCLYGEDTYTFTGLKHLNKYCVFAFVFDEDSGAGKFSYKEFTTQAPSDEVQDNYKKWIGMWTVTSTSSEVSGKPLSFDIVVSEKKFCESYNVQGWGISIARMLATEAKFDMETGYMYFENAYQVSKYADSEISGWICHFGRFNHGDGYYMVTEGGIVTMIARLEDENGGKAVGNEFYADSEKPYQFSCLDYFLYAGGTIYNFSPASQYLNGDFPIGPYTIKKKNYVVSSDLTLDLEVEETSSTTARIGVTPSNADETYFFDVMLASDVDQMDDAVLVMQLENVYASYGGLANFLYKGSRYQDYSGMTAGTEYCVVAFGYDTDHPTTAVTKKRFALSGSSESNALVLTVTNPSDKGAIISVSPSSTETYFWNIYQKSFVDRYGSDTDALIKGIDTFLGSQGGIGAFLQSGAKAMEITSLDPDTDYYVVAFGHNGNVATSSVYKKAFKTDASGVATDEWKAWLGTWDVTSATSEVSKKPVTMRVVIRPGTTGKKYNIRGWGTTAPRNTLVASVEGEFQPSDSALSVKNYQIFAKNANYGSYGTADVAYCARVYDRSTGKYVPITGEFYAMSAVLDKNGESKVRMAAPSVGSKQYVVSSMEVTLITSTGGVLYYNAAEGFTYGDFPVGPYTMKKVSDSQDVVENAVPSWYASGKSLNSTRYWPVTVGCPEMTVKPQPGKTRTPVSMSAHNLYNAPVRFYAGPSEGNLNLGSAFMIQGGKLSYKINQQ